MLQMGWSPGVVSEPLEMEMEPQVWQACGASWREKAAGTPACELYLKCFCAQEGGGIGRS